MTSEEVSTHLAAPLIHQLYLRYKAWLQLSGMHIVVGGSPQELAQCPMTSTCYLQHPFAMPLNRHRNTARWPCICQCCQPPEQYKNATAPQQAPQAQHTLCSSSCSRNCSCECCCCSTNAPTAGQLQAISLPAIAATLRKRSKWYLPYPVGVLEGLMLSLQSTFWVWYSAALMHSHSSSDIYLVICHEVWSGTGGDDACGSNEPPYADSRCQLQARHLHTRKAG